ncbi:head-tail connector protein [Micromonospora humida]|uniref:head-tail connector protein n=1 Tax=Micromonospora humida TaxID=2809018 RepID=UPI0036703E4B
MAGFVTLAEVKDHLNIPAGTTVHDGELQLFIDSASEVVEGIVGAVSDRVVVETHSGGRPVIVLDVPPIKSVTSVTENGRPLPASGYSLNGDLLTRSVSYYASAWLPGTNNITVTYVAGRDTVPASVLDGTKELIRLNWRPQTGGSGSVFNQSPDSAGGGGEVRLGFFVPNTVMQRLQPHALGPLVA